MLAYRHAFHAGNHGDVLKHLTLCEVLRHMGEKEKPYTLVDTHAGAGGYSLEGRYANKRGEYENGIGMLWDAPACPPPWRTMWSGCANSMADRSPDFSSTPALRPSPRC